VQCTRCNHRNESAHYCVKCGASLEVAATAQSTGQLQQVKQVSKQYLSYAVQVLKSPAQAGQASDAGHLINGIITLVLFAFILPLIMYFQLKSLVRNIGFFGLESNISFGAVVLKPFFFLLLFILLMNSIILLVLKIGNNSVHYREVTARFGAFMIPAVAFLLIALLFSLLNAGSLMINLLTAAGLFSWFAAVCFVIYTLKKEHTGGLDAFYAVVITYMVSLLILVLFGDDVFSSLVGSMGRSFNF
jgi:hypothetical protein